MKQNPVMNRSKRQDRNMSKFKQLKLFSGDRNTFSFSAWLFLISWDSPGSLAEDALGVVAELSVLPADAVGPAPGQEEGLEGGGAQAGGPSVGGGALGGPHGHGRVGTQDQEDDLPDKAAGRLLCLAQVRLRDYLEGSAVNMDTYVILLSLLFPE